MSEIALMHDAVFKAFPRHRQVLPAAPQNASKSQNRVGDLTADLLDHQPLDDADLFAVGAEYRRSLDAIAGNEAVRRWRLRIGYECGRGHLGPPQISES